MRLISFNAYRTFDVPGAAYIKPELLFRHREEVAAADWVLFPEYWQVNAVVYGLKRRIFPSVASYHLGHDKVEMTRVLEAAFPQHVPWTEIRAATEAEVEALLGLFDPPFIVKEVRSSRGRGVHRIESRGAFRDYARSRDVLYVQELLPIDRDLRVVWVGDRVVDAYWRIAPEGGLHNNVARGGRVSFESVPPAAVAVVERVARALGIDHAGFDVAVVDGHCYILEFNVLFGNEALNARGHRLGPVILDYLRRRTEPPGNPPAPMLPTAG